MSNIRLVFMQSTISEYSNFIFHRSTLSASVFLLNLVKMYRVEIKSPFVISFMTRNMVDTMYLTNANVMT